MVNPPKQSQQCKKDNSPPPQTLELQELVPRDLESFLNLFHQSVDPICMSWIVEYLHESFKSLQVVDKEEKTAAMHATIYDTAAQHG